MEDELKRAHEETHAAWEANAAHWDQRIGEGNDFVDVLIWPATQRLLQLSPGERILDVACGNGVYARRLAALGAEVVAFDFSAALIEKARGRAAAGSERITYQVLDATDEAGLLALGEGTFDAALCQMALFDMSEIDPLMRALARLLKPGGTFLFSVMHPCFNGAHMTHLAEAREEAGLLVTHYSVKIDSYLTPILEKGIAVRGQPQLQVYFHRPLYVLLGAAFRAGFVMDGVEEPAFPPDHPQGRNPFSWGGHYSEIPPVLVVRMRR